MWRGVYFHHGIVASAENVIEFGGGTILEKQRTRVQEVSIGEFERGSRAQAVRHPITHMGLTYSHASAPDIIVRRAWWLLDNQPPAYHLAGRNCEHVAIWCVTGNCYESFQVKWVSLAGAVISGAVMFGWRRMPNWMRYLLVALSTLIAYFCTFQYNRDSYQFGEHVRKFGELDANSQ